MNALESTLRGIVALSVLWPESQTLLARDLPAFDPKQKLRVLSALEATVPTVELSEAVRGVAETLASDEDASLALQAVVVLEANARGRPHVSKFSLKATESPPCSVARVKQQRFVEELANRQHGVDTVSANAAIGSRRKHMERWLESPLDRVRVEFDEALEGRDFPLERPRIRGTRRDDWKILSSAKETLFLQVLGRHRLGGGFTSDGDLRLAMAVLNADDPVFLLGPTRFDLDTLWAERAKLNASHDSEIELLAGDAARRRIPGDWRLMGARSIAYSDRYRFTWTLRTWLTSSAEDMIRRFEVPGVPSDRSFAWYDAGAYDVHDDPTCAPLTFDAGGIRALNQSGSELVPNVPLWCEFGWTPSANDPFIWTRDDEEVARLQKIRTQLLGRPQEDHPERQPLIVRWLISEVELARIEGARSARFRERTEFEKDSLRG